MVLVRSADGLDLNVEVSDFTDPWRKPELIILQHGFGRSSQYWRRYTPYLGRHLVVACPNLRGLGGSQAPEDLVTGITLDRYLSDFLSIADQFGADSFHFAGESSGGMLGMALAATYPDRVRSLTLFNSSLTIRRDSQDRYAHGHASWEDAIRAMGAKQFAEAQNSDPGRFPPEADPGLVAWATDLRAASDVEVMIAFTRLARTLDLTPRLGDIACPTLGLYAADGAVCKSGQADIIAQNIPDFRMEYWADRHSLRWLMLPATMSGHILRLASARDGQQYRDD